MQPLSCQRCGAALAVPADLSEIVVRCQFCGEQTPLPNALLALRAQERQLYLQQQAQAQARASAEQTTKSVARSMWLFVGLILGVPLVLTLGIFIFIFVMAKTVQDTSAATAATALAIPVPTDIAPPPAPRASDAKSTGEDRTTVLMKQFYDKGCKTVIMAPIQSSGESSLKASFVVNGTCVRVLAITGVADNKLTLTMKTPFGETIATPEASTEVDFTYCPKTPGPHPMSIVPATDDFYTVAAVECPASLSKKK